MRRILLTALLLLPLLGILVCCTDKDAVPGGRVRIMLGSQDVLLRSVTPGDGDEEDGGGVAYDAGDPDLVILIANNSSGSIVKKYPTNGNLQPGADEFSMAVTFDGLTEGEYTVYAFANTTGLWDMESGGSPVTDLLACTTKTQVEALQFSALASDTPPALRNARLPLSAMGALSVSSLGTGEVDLDLVRCVSKVSLSFINHTGDSLELDEFEFSLENLCPDQAYVLPVALPTVPAGITYGDLSDTIGDDVTFTTEEVKTYSYLVFPGVAAPPSRSFLMNVWFKANGSATTSEFLDLPIHDNRAVDIVSLERNQHLRISTRISRGHTVSFNFEVAGWTEKEELVRFD